jgi:glycosyltransferase involved in cell wall biosynthesis
VGSASLPDPDPGEEGRARRPRVVLVGHAPPPLHGQAVADALLAGAAYHDADVAPVRLSSARHLADIGAYRPRKLIDLVRTILQVLALHRSGYRDVLAYSLGARSNAPILRDLAVVGLVRRGFDRVVFHVHTGDYGARLAALPAPFRRLGHAVFSRAELILLDPLLHEDGRGFPAPAAIHYLPYGSEDPGARPPAQPPGPPLICFLGNLHEEKGTTALVFAAARLAAKRVPFRLVLAGGTPDHGERARLDLLIDDLGLGAQVEVRGPVEGVGKAALLGEATLFCLPSAYPAEGQPIAIIEAMAAGLPVVATRWRAIPSLVEDGVTGRLVEPGDIAGLADGIEALLTQPELARSMGEHGRRRFEQRHSASAFVRGFEAILAGTVPAVSAQSAGAAAHA